MKNRIFLLVTILFVVAVATVANNDSQPVVGRDLIMTEQEAVAYWDKM